MFDLLSIEITNFKSFKGNHRFEFPNEPGLYYLTGENKFNPRLGANGVGKTNLIDAWFWCLQGKTTRGLRAGDVVSWGEKKCAVTSTMVIGSKEMTFCRTQNPNKLCRIVDGSERVIDQDELDNLIRLNGESIKHSIMLPQFGRSFFDLSPTEKLTLFSDILGLDHWLDLSKKASIESESITESIRETEMDMAALKGKVQALTDDIKTLKVKELEFEKKREANISTLSNENKRLMDKLHDLREQKEKGIADYEKAEKEAREIVAELKELKELLDELKYKKNKQTHEQDSLTRRAKELERDIKNIKDMKGSPCPTCHQKVTEYYANNHEKHVKEKINELSTQAEEHAKELNKTNIRIGKTSDKLERVEKKYDKACLLVNNIDRELREIRYEIKSTISHRDRTAKQIEKLKADENFFAELISKNRKQIKKVKSKIKDCQYDLDALEATNKAVTYWISGFKRVRLYIIESAVKELELEVNNNLTALGLLDWSVTFAIEHENKSGTISKGFSVFINSPKHDKHVKWESWSGGETQRLRLAGDLGLSNLIMERTGLRNAIEFYDEPSEHMSAEGREDLVDTLYERAHNTNRKIWLVEHNTLSFGGFSGVLKLVMGKDGVSNLVYESKEG